VLWDCFPLATREAMEHVRSLGGLKAIAVSHPHFHGAVADWSEAFGGVPVYLHGVDRQWVTRPHPAIVPWTRDGRQIGDGITLVGTGGHFTGATILHWRAGAEGCGALLTGDIAMVAIDRRSLSFMGSFPNYIPLMRIRSSYRPRGSTVGVRPHLWRVVEQEHRGRREDRVRCFRPAIPGRDFGLSRPEAGERPVSAGSLNLATAGSIVISGLSNPKP
jgi:glyoxylase-like metal-dependent hydrolase (beta-lactamase superfamily II)